MKLYYSGETGSAICEADGPTTMTYAYRDVAFSDKSGVAKDILVGVCDTCGKVVAIPPQSTPAIKAGRDHATVAIEANLPAVYIDALDLACLRIDASLAPDFRKRLLLYYVHRFARNKKAAHDLAKIASNPGKAFREGERTKLRRRLSLKVSPNMSHDIDRLTEVAGVTRTGLFKSLVLQIAKDIVAPKKPGNLDELRALAATASC